MGHLEGTVNFFSRANSWSRFAAVMAKRLCSSFVLLGVLGFSSSALAAPRVEADPEVGKKLFYERGCSACHSFDGSAKQGPTLMGLVGKTRAVITAEKPRELVADEVYIRRSILEPNHDILQGYVPGAMPGLPITPEEATHLAAGIVKLSGPAQLGDKARGSLAMLAVSMLAFVLSHLGMSSLRGRRPFEKVLGANGFRGVYSLVSIAAMMWMVSSFQAAPYIELFRAPPWTRFIPFVIMPVALLFFIGSVSTKNPTSVGQEKAVEFEPKGIIRVTRHPMLWSFALWGMVHCIANGDMASLILFSGISTLAIAGMLHIDSRRRVMLGETWDSFADKTSIVPFARGNVGKALKEIGVVRVLVMLVVFGGLLHFHKTVIGVSALP